MYIIDSTAALLKQANDVFIFNLLMHFKFLKSGIQGLKESPEVIIVGEVGLRKLKKIEEKRRLFFSLDSFSQAKLSTTQFLLSKVYPSIIPSQYFIL